MFIILFLGFAWPHKVFDSRKLEKKEEKKDSKLLIFVTKNRATARNWEESVATTASLNLKVRPRWCFCSLEWWFLHTTNHWHIIFDRFYHPVTTKVGNYPPSQSIHVRVLAPPAHKRHKGRPEWLIHECPDLFSVTNSCRALVGRVLLLRGTSVWFESPSLRERGDPPED